MLHNLCIQFKVPFDENLYFDEREANELLHHIAAEPINNNLTADAKKIRNEIKKIL